MQHTDLSIVLPIHHAMASKALTDLSRQLKELSGNGPLTTELIVVDDASSDRTVTFAREALQGVERVKLIQLESNGGPGRARNVGINVAEGEFIAFADADDLLDLSVFLEGVSLARKSTADVVSLGYQELGESGAPVLITPQHVDSLGPLLTHRAAVWRFVFRSDFLTRNDICFPDFYYAEDVVFVLRVAEAGPRVESLPKCAYTYHLHSDGLSGSAPTPKRAEIALQELLNLERSGKSHEVTLLARMWAARIAYRSWRGLIVTNPRLLVRHAAAVVLNPKAVWLLATSTSQARRRMARA